MNLADVIRFLADEWGRLAETELKAIPPDVFKRMLRSYAIALRALAETVAQREHVPVETPEETNRRMIEKARQELRVERGKKEPGDDAEEMAVMMVRCIGGPADDCVVEIPAGVVQGACTKVMNAMYRMTADGLQFMGE